MVAIDYDIGASRAEPPVELAATVLRWVEAGFRAAGADPRIGARLGPMLRAAGYEDVAGFGVQGYLQPHERPERLLAGVARSLAPQILASGIATEQELGLDTLDARLAEAVAAEGSVVLPPCVAGAWAVQVLKDARAGHRRGSRPRAGARPRGALPGAWLRLAVAEPEAGAVREGLRHEPALDLTIARMLAEPEADALAAVADAAAPDPPAA